MPASKAIVLPVRVILSTSVGLPIQVERRKMVNIKNYPHAAMRPNKRVTSTRRRGRSTFEYDTYH